MGRSVTVADAVARPPRLLRGLAVASARHRHWNPNMKLLHTMLRVGDLDRSIAFYRDVLGLKLVSRRDYPEGRFTLAFMGAEERIGGIQRGAELELTHNWDTARYELGTGYGHVALEVADAYAACEQVKARGGKVTREAGPMKHGTTVIAFVEDPDGYKIEFIQRRSGEDAGTAAAA